jgi:hypothetical protein
LSTETFLEAFDGMGIDTLTPCIINEEPAVSDLDIAVAISHINVAERMAADLA